MWSGACGKRPAQGTFGKTLSCQSGSHAFFANTSQPPTRCHCLSCGPGVGRRYYVSQARGQWRYLAIVIDKYSRRVVGWSLGRNKDVALTLASLNRAVFHRRPGPGVIFHTDRGIRVCWLCVPRPTDTARFCTEHEPPGEVDRQCAYGIIFSLHEVRCRSRCCF